MINKEIPFKNDQGAGMPSTLKEFIKIRSTMLQDRMRAEIEKREKEAHKEVLQTKVDRSQHYDIDGVSMDDQEVTVAGEDPAPHK